MAFEPAIHAMLTEPPLMSPDPIMHEPRPVAVYPEQIAQTKGPPALTYFRVSTESFDPVSGVNPQRRARLQVDVWQTTFKDTRELADMVRQRLNGYWAAPGVRPCITGIRHIDDNNIPQGEQGATPIHHIAQDYHVWWEED